MTVKQDLEAVEGKLSANRKRTGEIFGDAEYADGDLDLTKVKGNPEDIAAELKTLNDEASDLAEDRKRLKTILFAAERTAEQEDSGDHGFESDLGRSRAAKSLGEQFRDAGVFKNKGQSFDMGDDFEIKTLFSTTAGWAPEVTRTPRLVESAQRPVEILDMIPQTTTGQTAVSYMEETTFTNNAAETAEGATKPEAALALTEKTSPVRKIAVLLPVTDEQLEDEPRVVGYVNNRLPFMVRQRLSNQIINGDGSAPNLEGMLNVTGIQSQEISTDPVPDAYLKAMTKVMTTGQASPDSVAMNPLDWQTIRLLKTTDGIYIWGSPSEAGPRTIWGLSVALAQVLPADQGAVFDSTFTELAIRKNVTVEVGLNADDWAKNRQTLRAEMRAAFLVYRPTAVCEVIPTPDP